MSQKSSSGGIKVSPAVAQAVAKDASQDIRLKAARAELDLRGRDLLLALVFLWYGDDPEVKAEVGKTLRRLPEEQIMAALEEDEFPHPRLLLLLARSRWRDKRILDAIIARTELPIALLEAISAQAPRDILVLFDKRKVFTRHPELIPKVLANPAIDELLRNRLSPPDNAVTSEVEVDGDDQSEKGKLSKYQQSLEMKVAEKIKMALTGDKEWRAIFLKDSNKLVCSAVMKNPRITDGEALAVARLKTSNEELIRLITMNKDWIKNPEIKKALVTHPRTPLPKALKYMEVLGVKDLKQLAKSKGVSQVLVNAARKRISDLAKKQ